MAVSASSFGGTTEYEFGLVFGESVAEDTRWQDQGLCHWQWDIFDDDPGWDEDEVLTADAAADLTEEELHQRQRSARKRRREYQLRSARAICFECPVFQQCWDDAYDGSQQGVIQAGALLTNRIEAQRIKRLVIAHDMYTQYQLKKEYDHDRRIGAGRRTNRRAGTRASS